MSTVQWPALIKYYGDDSLSYVHDDKVWLNDDEFSLAVYDERDILIDSQGVIFSLLNITSESKAPVLTNSMCSLDELNELLRKSAVAENYCCATKVMAKSYQDAMNFIRAFSIT